MGSLIHLSYGHTAAAGVATMMLMFKAAAFTAFEKYITSLKVAALVFNSNAVQDALIA
ncbi:MAG: hypothetical protein LJE83_11955 [Gammaproteobacteria bacterium]|jgi:hypothetical protein|nr:hypothetical protein [Gammaproteobacteria bacterium]